MPPIRRKPAASGTSRTRAVAGRGRVPTASDTAASDTAALEAASETAMSDTAGTDAAVSDTVASDASLAKSLVTGPESLVAEQEILGTEQEILGTERDSVSDDATGLSSTGPRRSSRLLAFGLVLAVGLVSGGVGIYLHQARPGITYSNSAFVNGPATDEVSKAAVACTQRLVAIDYRKLDAYHDSLGQILTPELVAELDKSWATLRSTYAQSKTVVDAKVSDVGVSFLSVSGDKAEVLVVQDVSMQRDGQAAGSTTGTYLVTLTKSDGAWKLSKIPDLPS